ncbi:MAG: hypothetical protein HS104_27020 [Polyangiaceae bacterium]|nr:hypothetical protein [Polyangiaceae bacterium]
MRFDEFCRRADNLRVDRARGRAKPYKPLLLAAVVMMIAKRKVASPEVALDDGLKSAFEQLLRAIYPDWPYKVDVRLPFRHLERDGIWQLVPIQDAIPDYVQAVASKARAYKILRSVAFARLDRTVFAELVKSPTARLHLLTILFKALDRDAFKRALGFVLEMVYADEGAPSVPLVHLDWTERAIEEYLQRNWQNTPFAELGIQLCSQEKDGIAGRQVFTHVSQIDLLGVDAKRRHWWVFELKKGRPPDAVVGQASRYVGWMQNVQRNGKQMNAKGVVLAERCSEKLEYAVRAHKNLSLWTFDSEFNFQRVE